MQNNLILLNNQSQEVLSLAKQLSLPQEIASLLYNRGITDLDSAKKFLHPKIEDMASPWDLANIREIVDRINQAIENDEKIVIFGDYDCDGICATAILKLYLQSVGANVEHYIPTRAEGYGLSEEALEKVADEMFPDLLITVDCGITAIEEVDFIYEVLGFDVIVTDHHEPYDELPECLILNPKITENSPLHDICGAGVALKLVEALSNREKALEYIDIACIATLADVVPLRGENRIIASYGLKKINKKERLGIKLLVESASLSRVSSLDVGFKLAPRINASGRLGSAQNIVDLFTSKEHFELSVIVADLNTNNQKRQQLTKKVYDEALVYLKDYDLLNNKIIILESPNWESGIIGIVAARLAEEFHRPTILFNSKTEFLKGSARSIDGINIFECIDSCSELLEGYGGHYGAAGLTINTGKLGEFKRAINEYIENTYSADLFIPKHEVDFIINPQELTKQFYKDLSLLEPFGEGNPSPRIGVSLSELKPTTLHGGLHVKARMNQDCDLMAFNKSYLLKSHSMDFETMLIGEAEFRTFANRDYIQFSVNNEVVESVDNAKDSALSFASYLKTALYGSSVVDFRAVEEKDLIDFDGYYGNLYVAFSAETVKNFLAKCGDSKTAISQVSVGTTLLNPINKLLICPDGFSHYGYFERVVFLDCPLSTGYIKKTMAKGDIQFVKHYAFGEVFKGLSVDDNDVKNTLDYLDRFVIMSGRANNVFELFERCKKYGYELSPYDFITHFYALYDMGIVKVREGFDLAINNKAQFASNTSVILQTVKRLKKIL